MVAFVVKDYAYYRILWHSLSTFFERWPLNMAREKTSAQYSLCVYWCIRFINRYINLFPSLCIYMCVLIVHPWVCSTVALFIISSSRSYKWFDFEFPMYMIFGHFFCDIFKHVIVHYFQRIFDMQFLHRYQKKLATQHPSVFFAVSMEFPGSVNRW